MKTYILKKILLIAGCVLAALSPLARADDADFSKIERSIERALYRNDVALLAEADGELAKALAAEPKRPELRYLEGFAAYARATFEYATNDKKALRLGLELADELLAKVKGEPWEHEALALRGYITGQLIGVRGRMSGMTLGPKMMRQTTEALDGTPPSGRTLMFHGVTLLNTPETFGGDPAEALRLFTRAKAAFEKEAAGWGAAEACYWLARARMKAGDFAGAKEAAEAALGYESDFKDVRYRLLPEIEKKLGGN